MEELERSELRIDVEEGIPDVYVNSALESKVEETKDSKEKNFPNVGEDLRIENVIGAGAMGTVYMAADLIMGCSVAIKVLRADLARDAVAARRFEQEVEAAAALDHPNLVSVYRHGKTLDGVPFLVMDHIEGLDLSRVLKNEGKLSERRCIELLLQLTDALNHAHSRKILHRDLKPSNIILRKNADKKQSESETLKIVDLGIAKVLTSSSVASSSLTKTGELIGSPAYMSPEHSQGEDLDERSDIYSLGCVMVELLTGRPPYEGAHSVQVILKHINEPLEHVEHQMRKAGVTEELIRVILCCLAKNREHRYANTKQLQDDIIKLSKGEAPENARVVRPPRSRHISPTTSVVLLIVSVILAVPLAAAFGVVTMGWMQAMSKVTAYPYIANAAHNHRTAHNTSLQQINSSQITDELLRTASKQDLEMTSLDLSGSRVTDKGLSYLTKWRNLRHLYLDDMNITDRGIQQLQSMNRLETLALSGTQITDKGVERLVGMKRLRKLFLKGTMISDAGLASVAKLPDLRQLCLTKTRVSDAGLSYLQSTPIESMHLVGTRVTDVGARNLSKMASLHELQLKSTALTDSGLQALSHLPALSYLDVEHTDITDEGVKSLTGSKSIVHLDLSRNRIGDKALKYLETMPNLKELELAYTVVTDRGVESLKSLPSLRNVDLTRTSIDDGAMKSVSDIVSLETLRIGGTAVSNTGLSNLTSLRALKSLSVKGCAGIDQQGILKLRRSSPYLSVN